MIDSSVVLWGQTVAYTCYCIALILLVGWFGMKITRPAKDTGVKPVLFYSFVTMLVVLGVSLHIITYNTIPWASIDLNRSEIKADRTFNIAMRDHKFILGQEKMTIRCGEKALFLVTSDDLTYGFGLFRADNSMLFQMQVIPGHKNDILWKFEHPGVYSIRSTEYSGPEGTQMIVKDAVVVTDKETSQNN
jgi:cytochrome c oxidase subunit II